MIATRRFTLSDYLTRLLSEGRVVFLREEAQDALAMGRGALLDAAERLQRRGRLISPRRGFYVIVPPQHLAWGAPPASWFLDDLMRYEGRPYYVGLLKAAELHGATHQAVMEYQVVTDKRLPRIKAGRSSIVFYFRKTMETVVEGIDDHRTDTGRLKVSSIELTLLDLLRYPRAGGQLDNIATVLCDLGERLDQQRLAALAPAFERAVVQRLGYLLDSFGLGGRTGSLFKMLARSGTLPWVELEPLEGEAKDFASAPLVRDRRWRVVVRQIPEPDR